MWFQRRVLRVNFTHHVSKQAVRDQTGCTPVLAMGRFAIIVIGEWP